MGALGSGRCCCCGGWRAAGRGGGGGGVGGVGARGGGKMPRAARRRLSGDSSGLLEVEWLGVAAVEEEGRGSAACNMALRARGALGGW